METEKRMCPQPTPDSKSLKSGRHEKAFTNESGGEKNISNVGHGEGARSSGRGHAKRARNAPRTADQ